MADPKPGKIMIENVIQRGKTYSVDATKYAAARKALLAVLPANSPGMTMAEIHANMPAHLPQDLFPGGAKAGWWTKAAQLDLEAKGVIRRENTKPLRLHKA
jgi:hypothetical protein